jgi:hypothetical protein
MQPAELVAYMAAGWTDEQLTAAPDLATPAPLALAAIRNQAKAAGQLA